MRLPITPFAILAACLVAACGDVKLDSRAARHTVRFDSQGGSTVADQQVVDRAKALLPAPPQKGAEGFSGWYREATALTRWDFAADVVTNELTLYAGWQPASAGLVYEKVFTGYAVARGGATGGMILIPDWWAGEPVSEVARDGFTNSSALTNIRLSTNLRAIGYRAFFGCIALPGIDLPQGLARLGNEVFMGCVSLTNLHIPASVTNLGAGLLAQCSGLLSYHIPSHWQGIPVDFFHGCTNLVEVVLPAGLEIINDRAFNGCTALANLVIPESVTTIGNQAFGMCQSLTSQVIPLNVVSIKQQAFLSSKNLENVTLEPPIPPLLQAGVFADTHPSLVFHVPAANSNAYLAAPGWAPYTNRIVGY